MIKLNGSMTMIYTLGNIDYDFDCYEFEVTNGLSTQEYTVIICFKDLDMQGSCIAYGSWFDITSDDCMPYVEYIIDNELVLRDFTHIVDNYQKEVSHS